MKKISLPGYFTKHFFIKAILEIFDDYREYFYDDIMIDNSYDLPNRLIWNGGRVVSTSNNYTQKTLEKIMDFYIQKNFPLWHTCTNMMLTQEHMSDKYCNDFFDQYLKPNDKIIINNPILLEYMKNKWNPEFVYSTTIGLRDLNKINQISRENIVCINYNDQVNMDYMSKLIYPNNIEIIAGEACHLNCPHRKRHYEATSLFILGEKTPDVERDLCCPNHIQSEKSGIEYMQLYDGFLPLETMNQLADMGFKYFKIAGREGYDQQYLEALAYYMIKPEFKHQFIRKMMLRKTAFNVFDEE